jgi:hypothetical protein
MKGVAFAPIHSFLLRPRRNSWLRRTCRRIGRRASRGQRFPSSPSADGYDAAGRCQKSEAGGQGVRDQWAEVRVQRSEIRSQRSEVGVSEMESHSIQTISRGMCRNQELHSRIRLASDSVYTNRSAPTESIVVSNISSSPLHRDVSDPANARTAGHNLQRVPLSEFAKARRVPSSHGITAPADIR